MLREWMADGMLINYLIGIPEPLVQMVRQHSVPSMWINVQQPPDCVYPNDLDAESGRRSTCFPSVTGASLTWTTVSAARWRRHWSTTARGP